MALIEASPDPASTALVKISEKDAFSVLGIAARWPIANRFPIVDLARLIAARAPSVVSLPTNASTFIQTLLSVSGWMETPWPTPLPKAIETNVLLALRGFANIFQPSAISGLGGSEIIVRGHSASAL